MSSSLLCAMEVRAAEVTAMSPPKVMRQSTLSALPYVQLVLGDDNLAALIFAPLPVRPTRAWIGLARACRFLYTTRHEFLGRAGMLDERSYLVYLAKLAEGAERNADMLDSMTCAAATATARDPLTVEERDLLSVAYTRRVASFRSALRSLPAMSAMMMGGRREQLENYLSIVRLEKQQVCAGVMLVVSRLREQLDVSGQPDAALFYLKFSADILRHLAEDEVGERRAEYEEAAEAAYQSTEPSVWALPATHPTRLGLALRWATFRYDVQGRPEEACALARGAFDDAIAELEDLDDQSYRDATAIMQLLRDSLAQWTPNASA